MKLETINVVELVDGKILGIASFTNDENGKKQSFEHFMAIANESEISEKSFDICFKEREFELGNYKVAVVNSNKIPKKKKKRK